MNLAMNGTMEKVDTKQMSQWLYESISAHESPQNILIGYVDNYRNIEDEKKQNYAKEMLAWMKEADYIPFDLDIPCSIELIGILSRNVEHDIDALIMLFILSYQNYLIAGPVDKGFIANEMLHCLIYNGGYINDFCEEIQKHMMEDPMFDTFTEVQDEEERVIMLYPNLISAFLPAYHWLKNEYPQACYNFPEDFVEKISSYSDSDRAFNIYSSFCRYLYFLYPDLH